MRDREKYDFNYIANKQLATNSSNTLHHNAVIKK
jgi:hypothetical protein